MSTNLDELHSNDVIAGLHEILRKMESNSKTTDDVIIYKALRKAYNDEEILCGVVLMTNKHISVKMGFLFLNKIISNLL